MRETIGSRIFALADLAWFAAASGDWNPIHVDPIRARRLLAGDVIVHGMDSLLWALERYFAAGGGVPLSISAYFARPILAGDSVNVQQAPGEGGGTRLALVRAEEEVVNILLGGAGQRSSCVIASDRPSVAKPADKSFEQLAGSRGSMDVTASPGDLHVAFPHACRALGDAPVAGFMAFSRIVGMECPGLNSLFTGLAVVLDPQAARPALKWEVIQDGLRPPAVRIGINGAGISGTLQAFVRPQQTAQPPLSEVAKSIEAGAFQGQRALVIGGSRGLGELAAKIIAAGGGEVCITYRSGSADAQRVVHEISASGARCRSLALDVNGPALLLPELARSAWVPTHTYYFATPRIAGRKGPDFDQAAFEVFNRIYCTGFEQLVRSLVTQAPSLVAFYPSSVFLNEPPKGFAEYVAAKTVGEALCDKLSRELPNLRIVVRRLPRLATDQTASLLPQAVKPALNEMESVVREMHAGSSWRGHH